MIMKYAKPLAIPSTRAKPYFHIKTTYIQRFQKTQNMQEVWLFLYFVTSK